MSATEFRAALAALDMTQAAFARFLVAHGHPAADVARSVRRWAQIGPPAEVVVILRMMDEKNREPVEVSEFVAHDIPKRRR